MTRIRPLDPGKITGWSKILLDNLQRDLGFVPILMRLLAHSPAALGGYTASTVVTTRPGVRGAGAIASARA